MEEFYKERPQDARIMEISDEYGVNYIHDVPYEIEDGHCLHLQILMPKRDGDQGPWPCVLFVQGSHWAKQDVYHEVVNLGRLAEKGYVIAVVEYRSSEYAHFPSPVIDAKNAVRFMKAHCRDFGVDKDNVFLMGDSSGGHVALMAGMTAESGKFDDPLNQESPVVNAMIDLYGSVDPTLEDGYPSTPNHQDADSPEGMEMGFDIHTHLKETQPAVVKNHVHESFGPVLIAHGTGDTTVSAKASVQLYEALKQAGKKAELILIPYAVHGDAAFYSDKMMDVYDAFFKSAMKGRQ